MGKKRRFMTKEERKDCLTLTLAGAAEMLGISIHLARSMADTGQLPTIRLGKKLIRVPRIRLMEMLAGNTETKQTG